MPCSGIMSSSAYQALWMTIARGFGIVVRPVEAADLHRKPVLAVIIIAGRVGAVRRRVGAEVVGEALDDSPSAPGPSRGRGRRGGFRPGRWRGRRRGSAARSTAARSRRCRSCRERRCWCWSSAALARANSCGSMPAGAEGVRICACGCAASGASGSGAAVPPAAAAEQERSSLQQKRGPRRSPHRHQAATSPDDSMTPRTLPIRSGVFIIQWVNVA